MDLGKAKIKLVTVWRKSTLVRFSSSSALMFLVDFLGYMLLCNFWAPYIASGVSQGSAAVGNFILQRAFVFPKSRRHIITSFILTVVISCLSISIGSFTVYFVRTAYLEGIVLPKIIAILIVFVWNYLTRKYIVFPSRASSTSSIKTL